jgi:hypothetical protein
MECIITVINPYRLDAGFLDNSFSCDIRRRPAVRKVWDLLMSNVRIIHGDSLEAMKSMPDKGNFFALCVYIGVFLQP